MKREFGSRNSDSPHPGTLPEGEGRRMAITEPQETLAEPVAHGGRTPHTLCADERHRACDGHGESSHGV